MSGLTQVQIDFFESTIAPGLTQGQINFFDENGYLLIPNAIPGETVDKLVERIKTLLHDFSLEGHPMTKFSTGDGDSKHVGDAYFLESGDKVRFFFEEDAFDKDGNLVKPKERAINKIGHALHEIDPDFRKISLNRQNLAIARSLRFRDPRVLQSMVICKQPEIGGAVPPHQDSTFLYTDPPSAVGFWYALEDTTTSNGCLSFVPGSHKKTPIASRFVRINGGKDGTGFKDIEGVKPREDMPSDEEYVKAEVKAGTLVVIHGNVLHKSEKNLSQKSRYIYTFHMVEGESKYDELNWLQPTDDGFSKLNKVENE